MNVLETVVAVLNSNGINATLEYPGYINVGDKDFGTANEAWGWNDREGVNAGESTIPSDSTDADAIAAYILSVLK